MSTMNTMSGFIFPFSSPSPPDTPDPNTTAMATPDIPQTPNPGTLPIRSNPFNYLVTSNPSTDDTSTLRSVSATQPATTGQRSAVDMSLLQPPSGLQRSTTLARISPIADDTALPKPPPKTLARDRSNTVPAFEHSNGRKLANFTPNTSPFFNDNELEMLPPPKPWLNSEYGRASFDTRSVNSSVTSAHKAIPATLPNAHVHYGVSNASHPFFTLSLTPSLTSSSQISRFRKNPRFSLDRDVRMREAHKRYNHKLQLEREADEVRRRKPGASTSTLYLPLHGTMVQRISDAKSPIPPLLTSGTFWAAILLLQTGLVGTASVVAIIVTRGECYGMIVVSEGPAFFLVCSLAAVVLGFLGTAIVCIRKNNVCLDIQDRLGLNEIQDLRQGDLEMDPGGGFIYLGVDERDENSLLGVSSVRGGSARAWRPSVDGFKDPIWMELYRTPEIPSGGFRTGSPAPRERSKLQYSVLNTEEDDEMDIGAQRLEPTPSIRSETASVVTAAEDDDHSISTIAEDEEREFPSRDGAVGRCGFRNERDEDPDSDSNSMLTAEWETDEDEESVKNSPQEEHIVVNDRTAVAGKEINMWSPLDRLGRALRVTATTSSMNLKQQNFDSDEGLEMSDLSPPCTPKAKAKAKPLCQMPREVNFVGGQLHEYDGFWSPDVVEQRKEERRAERERRRFRKMQTKKDRTQNMIGAVRRAEGLDGTRDVVGTDLFVIGEEDEEGEEA